MKLNKESKAILSLYIILTIGLLVLESLTKSWDYNFIGTMGLITITIIILIEMQTKNKKRKSDCKCKKCQKQNTK